VAESEERYVLLRYDRLQQLRARIKRVTKTKDELWVHRF
jgi:hypothetical protein